jgi:hypothetical protein
MKAALIILQVLAAALSAFVTLHKPAPKPTVVVTDRAGGGISIAISCPIGYTLKYPGVTTVPTTDAERMNDANRAVCGKSSKAVQAKPVPQG